MSLENEEVTTHEEISKLWEEASKEEPTVKEETSDTSSELEPEKTDSNQTEDPVKKEEPQNLADEDPAKIEKEEEPKEPLLNQDKAPSGWSPKARERWNEIPEDLRGEILRREEASAKGVRQLQEEVAPMRGFVQTLAPFIQEAAQNARDPAQYIGSVMVTERVLRLGNTEQKFDALLGIADQYGIPLREIINKSVGEEVLKAPSNPQYQLPPEVQRELEESRLWRQQQSERATKTELDKFLETNPEFFDDVREDMIKLLESGMAADLQSAYDKAVKLNPEISEILTKRGSSAERERALKEKQGRASKASVRSDESLGGKGAPEKTDKVNSVEDDIRASIATLSGRD